MNERDEELLSAAGEEPQGGRESYEPPAIERFPALTNVSFQTGIEPVSTEGIA
jgi:hypothetical protein